ncbi:hypothetical protein PIB30_048659 [Stylosanthes scabra]|uniref:Peptidase C1A papain C-terminal domain-containing protein n=1 Tax=Stylosanthes scabra TaxID=79078 RepID=A0ABU6XHC4_9FABA|nr:hypothetical protein [Stylosanthes scabra]
MDDQIPSSMDMSTYFSCDFISRARHQNTNKNSDISCMQHALVAACEGKLNKKMVERGHDIVYKFSVHNLIFGCSRYLSKFEVDAYRGLDFRYGLRSWFLFPVLTTVNGDRRKVPSPVKLTDLLVLYSVYDNTNMGERCFDKVMAHMFRHGPVVATMQIFEDYHGAFQHDKYVYSTKQGSEIGYHAVALVGYNKEYRCFTYLNSHGEGFGNLGRGLVSFDCVVEILAPLFDNEVVEDMDASMVIRGEDELPAPPPPRGGHELLPPPPPV